jgi:tetratricopeptide (TPR) repeat protein
MRRKLPLLLVCLLIAGCAWGDARKAADKIRRADVEYRRHNYAGAEKLLRDAIKEDPDSVDAHTMLANLLSGTKRYSQARQEYGRVLEIDDKRKKLSDDARRRVIDGQAVAFAESGELERAKSIYLDALKQDPDYSMYNYNLACVYAELQDLDTALPYLKKSWEKRGTLPSDITFPDPRKDDSFKPYWDNPTFLEAVRNMVQ